MFNSIDANDFDGYYIVKINIIKKSFAELRLESKEKASYKNVKKKNIIIINFNKVFIDDMEFEIQITYFKKPHINSTNGVDLKKVNSNKVEAINDFEIVRFDLQDMKWFYDNSNDSNSIHRGEKLIVPAIVILKKINFYLEDLIKKNRIVNIKFNDAIHLFEDLNVSYMSNLKFELNIINCSSNNNKIFIYGVK